MIEARGLSKRYGDLSAVDDVSFSVERGEVVGFLGPNGAGKTTTMRMLTGFLPPTDGSATIAGHDIFDDALAARRAVGYLPETPPLYPEMTVSRYLDYVARIKDVPRAKRREAVDRALARCVLTEVRDRVIGTLSKGFRQRVGLAQAIVHDPPVLILDEPTVGLDPIQIREIRGLIAELASGAGERQHTIILSSHILAEVAAICRRVIMINQGRKTVDAPIAELTAGGARSRSCSRGRRPGIWRRRLRTSGALWRWAGRRREEPVVKHVTTVAGRELRSLFVSPVAYVLLSLFSALAGLFFVLGRGGVQLPGDPAAPVPGHGGAGAAQPERLPGGQLLRLDVDRAAVRGPRHHHGPVLGREDQRHPGAAAHQPDHHLGHRARQVRRSGGLRALLVALVGAFPALLFVYGDPELGKTAAGLLGLCAGGLDLRGDRRLRVVDDAQPGVGFLIAFVLLLCLMLLPAISAAGGGRRCRGAWAPCCAGSPPPSTS
jgi:ABC-2 type transport system ATP-binding protein